MIPAVMPTYARADIAFDRGEGAYLTATDGRRFLDFGSGIAVDALGHCHPHLVAALTAQVQRLWHTSNLYDIPEQQRYAERLVAASFADSVFFCNSGAEAVEGALKLARRYWHETGYPEKVRVITCTGAFHGRTMATLSAAGNAKYLTGFGPRLEGFDQVPFGNLNELRDRITPETAAILVEPVQGEGGIRTAPPNFLQGLRAAATDFDLLLVYDEVQCGFGRTGKLFAHEWSGATPDILAAAKGIASGFPCGAILATERAASQLPAGSHGTTFGGNPLAMATANAVLDVILEDGFLANVQRIGAMLREGLENLATAHPDVIAEVRGTGLILGLRIAEPIVNTDFATACLDRGLLLVPAAENVVRILPPLIIGEAEVAEGMAKLEDAAMALTAAVPEPVVGDA